MKPKFAEMNAQMRRIQQEVSEVAASQQRIAMERQHYENTIRRELMNLLPLGGKVSTKWSKYMEFMSPLASHVRF